LRSGVKERVYISRGVDLPVVPQPKLMKMIEMNEIDQFLLTTAIISEYRRGLHEPIVKMRTGCVRMREDFMRRSWSRCLSVFCIGCVTTMLSLSSALGQTVTGSVTGVVTDPTGAVVVGATVTALNTESGVKTTTQTNGTGAYTIRFLPVGTYALTVDAKGFTPDEVAPFPLEINQTVKIDVIVKVTSSTTVVVNETVHPILDTTDSTLGNTLTTNEIQNIPLNGRNFSSLTLFQPGAVDTDPTGMSGNNAIERSTYNSGIASINGNRE
jgi:hypothetical protein